MLLTEPSQRLWYNYKEKISCLSTFYHCGREDVREAEKFVSVGIMHTPISSISNKFVIYKPLNFAVLAGVPNFLVIQGL
jgi:hypothetical protein